MEKIPLLDLKSQYGAIRNEINAAINGILESQHFVLGREVENLERELSSYCSAGYGVGVASGTDALFLSLNALGIESGDEVITTPLTFMATGGAISQLGAKPVFCDIDGRTYNIDPSLIEERITKKTKAILPVHLYGQCADMDPILEIAARYRLKVVEDCAQSIGSSYKGRMAGSMGDAGCISFYPSKNLGAFGDGGMVVARDKALADKIKLLRVHGSSVTYYHDILGYNSRLDNLQAAVLRVKLRFLASWIGARRRIAVFYDSTLAGLDLVTPFVPDYNTHTYHLYIITTPERERLLESLSASGIEARAYYPLCLHLQKCYSGLGYKKGDFPVAERVSAQALAIPIYPELKRDDMERVADSIKRALKDG